MKCRCCGEVKNIHYGTSAMTASTTISGSAISGNISGNAANVTGTVAVANGGTGVSNGTNNTITFTGNYTLGLTLTANTSVTLPTTGKLVNFGGAVAAAI